MTWTRITGNGRVWRAGANEATRFTFNREVRIEGHALTAGTYTLFAISRRGGVDADLQPRATAMGRVRLQPGVRCATLNREAGGNAARRISAVHIQPAASTRRGSDPGVGEARNNVPD